jgi:His-Xaa-Ser system protein HxsD
MEKHIILSKGEAKLLVNPAVYPIEAVYSASFVFLDRAYLLLDKEDENIVVMIKPKGSADPEKLALEFFNELINYSDYIARSSASADIKKLLLSRALFAGGVFEENEEVIIPWEDDKENKEE